MKTIDYDTLHTMWKNQENYVLIDVRSFDEYDEQHIPDADNIPLDEVDFLELVEKRVVSKEAKIVINCGRMECPLSTKAAEKLEQAGFKNVMDYKGGVKDWFEHEAKRDAA